MHTTNRWLASLVARVSQQRAVRHPDWHLDSAIFGLTRAGDTAIALAVRSAQPIDALTLTVTLGLRRATDDNRTVHFRRSREGSLVHLGIHPHLSLSDVLFVDVLDPRGVCVRITPDRAPSARVQWNSASDVLLIEPGTGTRVVRNTCGIRVHDRRCHWATEGPDATVADLQHALRDDARLCLTCIPRPPANPTETI